VAVVSTVAVSNANGHRSVAALTDGFQAAFAATIAFAAAGLVIALPLLRRGARKAMPASTGPAAETA
jgi:hypothetical protein